MKRGTKVKFGAKLTVMVKVAFAMIIMGLIEFVAGVVPPLA